VYFALWPDAEAVGHLSALARSLAPKGARLMRPESLHLTLAFIGGVAPNQVADLERIAAGVSGEAFDLSLDRLGFRPGRGILWAGCRETPAALRLLAESLGAAVCAAGFAVAHPPQGVMVPHITLARRVRCASLPRLETPVRWRAGEFALVETHLHPSAASYTTLASFPLAEPGAD
jgi:2'-5' RNA ligase